jgi:hypothetical protein
MSTVRTGSFSINRLTRNAVPAPLADAAAGVNEKPVISVTFVYTGLTGNTKVVNGVTWSEAAGTFSFSPDSIEIAYGDTADIKIKMDNNASTNGWKLVQFIPKSTNPSGGPVAVNADSNGNIEFTDSNAVAGTYYYGLYLESPSNNRYISYDPAIVQDGGGEG